MPRCASMDKYDSYLEPAPQETQPVVTRPPVADTQPSLRKRKLRRLGCSPRLAIWIAVLLAVYFFLPFRTNILVLGIDRTPEGTDLGRSDTMILLGAQPLTGQVNLLSIPRDLWVAIPGYGESRINSAHTWGEGAQPGLGPLLALQTVREDFDVNVSYYFRIRLEGFADVIDALGGIDITLEQETAGYPAGAHHLDGTQALAFVRNRDGDDFYRMQHGHLFIVAMGKQLLNPLNWFRIPGALVALVQTVDTNIPFWSWPRLLFVLLRAILFGGIDALTIPREAVTPWVTADGAQVLLPNWDMILPIVREMFGMF